MKTEEKIMRAKLTALLAVCTLAASLLTGCGSNEETPASTETGTQEAGGETGEAADRKSVV